MTNDEFRMAISPTKKARRRVDTGPGRLVREWDQVSHAQRMFGPFIHPEGKWIRRENLMDET